MGNAPDKGPDGLRSHPVLPRRTRALSPRPLVAPLVRRAKNRSPISGDSTKKHRARLLALTETWTTPRGYCAVTNPGVPWCHKGFRDLSKPRITLRVGKLTNGDGS
ncbi:hypothetical protein GCM10010207_16130 [Streptomyces atratus]|nr:hypothetical protein GCM10010207_16130 [Streptomyces atratus]